MRLDSLSRLQRREKGLLWLCLAVGLVALTAKYAVGPYVARWDAVGEEIHRRERMLARASRALGRPNAAGPNSETRMAKIQSRGSSEEEIAAFLSEVESLSRKGVRITDIKPRRTEEGKIYRLISIDLDVEADIVPLSQFIYDLYQSPMLLDLEQIDLNPSALGTETLKGHLVVSRVLFRW